MVRWLGYSTGMKVDVVVKCLEDCYMAYVPHVPGCVSMGDTPEEAVDNLRDMIDDYLNADFEVSNNSISLDSEETRIIAG